MGSTARHGPPGGRGLHEHTARRASFGPVEGARAASPEAVRPALLGSARRTRGAHGARGPRSSPSDRVVEIGPGLGILTRGLAGAPSADLTAIEVDRRPRGVRVRGGLPLEFRLLHRRRDPKCRLGRACATRCDGWKLVANLPYNVGTHRGDAAVLRQAGALLRIGHVHAPARGGAAAARRAGHEGVRGADGAARRPGERCPSGVRCRCRSGCRFVPPPKVHSSAVIRIRSLRGNPDRGRGRSGLLRQGGAGGIRPAPQDRCATALVRASYGKRERPGAALEKAGHRPRAFARRALACQMGSSRYRECAAKCGLECPSLRDRGEACSIADRLLQASRTWGCKREPQRRQLPHQRGAQRLYVVADGMGGHAGGGVRLGHCGEHRRRDDRGLTSRPGGHRSTMPAIRWSGSPGTSSPYAIRLAGERIFDKAKEQPEYHGMGTTVVVLLVRSTATPMSPTSATAGSTWCARARSSRSPKTTR